MHLRRMVLVTIISMLLLPVNSQNLSLKEMVATVNDRNSDTVKVNMLLSICDSLYRTNAGETIEYGQRALDISESLKFQRGLAYSFKYIGMGYYIQADYISALKYFQKALDVFETLKFKKGIANMKNSMGVIYSTEGMDSQALDLYLESLKISEEINDSLRVVSAMINVGFAYSKTKSLVDKAKDYYTRALNIAQRRGYMDAIGTVNVNFGDLYYDIEEYDIALGYYEKSMKSYASTSTGNSLYTLISIGKIHAKKREYLKAIKYQEEALNIARQTNSKLEIVQAMIAITETYMAKGEDLKALELLNQAEIISQNIMAKNERRKIYEDKVTLYSRTGDCNNAVRYQQMESKLKDTIYSEATKFQMDLQKLRELVQENKDLKHTASLTEAKNKLQKTMILILIIGFLLISLFMILLVRASKKTNRSNEKLNQTNEELKIAFDMLNEHKKQIEAAHSEITASITYAKYIQTSVLPKSETMKLHLGEHFIFYRPKEIVSGDFYWYTNIDRLSVFAAVDCTGHGVPGAFMSMLGTALLDEIINKERILNPGQILQRLRNGVIQSLQQHGESGEVKDGMDLALCVIDYDNMNLQYSGANSPIYIIRKKENEIIEQTKNISSEDFILYELKGDRMPVSIHVSMENFTTHQFTLMEGDLIYLFSDGYADQFGGPQKKKLHYKSFKKILLNHCNEPIAEQKSSIESEFNAWKGENAQIDDVMVAGIRISKN